MKGKSLLVIAGVVIFAVAAVMLYRQSQSAYRKSYVKKGAGVLNSAENINSLFKTFLK